MDDFCGFTYKGVHSSELGLVRVSDGSRYFHNLTANFRDKTMEIPGGDGVYFFESLYNSNTFNINVAFDSVTEIQMRLIRQVFNGKDVGELIFDETPYKAYIVKVQSAPQIKYVCFMEEGQRIYKGEMTIGFISYYPYAVCSKKFLGEYTQEEYPNLNEWAAASGLIYNNRNYYDNCGSGTTSIKLYNPGDLPADFELFFAVSTLTNGVSLQLLSPFAPATPNPSNSQIINRLDIGLIPEALGSYDTHICINTKTNLIEGYNGLPSQNGTRTGSLYNKYIESGDFFKIPIFTDTQNDLILSTGTGEPGSVVPSMLYIRYDYLYY